MPVKPFPRILLVFAVLILGGGGVMHALAFPKALTVLGAVTMPDFYANSFRALWLIDSAGLIGLAMLLALIAARPALATRWVVVLLALLPASTAGLVYWFVGSFVPAHALTLAALMIVAAGLQFPRNRDSGR
jgi:hypothetical protein